MLKLIQKLCGVKPTNEDYLEFKHETQPKLKRQQKQLEKVLLAMSTDRHAPPAEEIKEDNAQA